MHYQSGNNGVVSFTELKLCSKGWCSYILESPVLWLAMSESSIDKVKTLLQSPSCLVSCKILNQCACNYVATYVYIDHRTT